MLVVVVGKTVGKVYVVMCLRSVLLQVSVMYMYMYLHMSSLCRSHDYMYIVVMKIVV